MITYYKDKSGKHRARIKAKNGEIIFGSHQGFSSKQKCKQNLYHVCWAIQDYYFGAKS